MYCSTTPLISRSIFSTLREIPFNYILSTFFSPDFNEVVESVHHHIDQRKNKHGKCLQNSIVKSTLGGNVYMQEFQTINRIFDLIKLVSLVFCFTYFSFKLYQHLHTCKIVLIVIVLMTISLYAQQVVKSQTISIFFKSFALVHLISYHR